MRGVGAVKFISNTFVTLVTNKFSFLLLVPLFDCLT